MHTFESGGTTFNSNSDLSGAVLIATPDGSHATVSGDALKAFIANYVMRCKISKLEGMSDDELLGID